MQISAENNLKWSQRSYLQQKLEALQAMHLYVCSVRHADMLGGVCRRWLLEGALGWLGMQHFVKRLGIRCFLSTSCWQSQGTIHIDKASGTTLYYKVLLQYYSVLQSTTPVLLCTTKYYSSTTLYYKVLLQHYSGTHRQSFQGVMVARIKKGQIPWDSANGSKGIDEKTLTSSHNLK